MIPIKKLTVGWYKGFGRNSYVAYWTGKTFLTIGNKFNKYVIKDEGYFEENGFGCFEPIKRI